MAKSKLTRSKVIPIVADVSVEHCRKYYALIQFSGQDVFDFGGLLLEQAIDDAWEGYRNNPKHSKQIKDWEKKNKQ